MDDNIVRKGIMAVRGLILPAVHTGKESWKHVAELIDGDRPFMMGRFGAVEVKSLLYNKLPPPSIILLKNIRLLVCRGMRVFSL